MNVAPAQVDDERGGALVDRLAHRRAEVGCRVEVCLTVDFDDRDAVGDVLGLNREYDVFDAVRPFHASGIAAHARVVVPRGRPAQTLAYTAARRRATIEPRLRSALSFACV